MARLSPPDFDNLSEAQQSVYEQIVSGPRGRVRGPLAIWLHRPDLADRSQALGRYCRYDTLLPPILSELAILVTARVWNSEFEWQAHKLIGLKAGLSPEIVDAIRDRRQPQFDADDQAVVYDFALAVQRDRKVSQIVYERAIAILGAEAVVDLTGLLGYYGLISMTINVFEVDPLDPDACEMN
ncbi:carboxymuconolactone decarboxylase family protein [Rhizobium halophytocola]|uniref:4-carboxymuconolactone decarboxylase n=1 Tax=Rhizobium halophytocola TaxID=735519 RepID=A0ABS4E646_9HYPH|nr:carboxymuconolactone decarboxylase family protein [Rhizobium halophytocola]MBP1853421.1 4-carboxymuconolactone decarboxylase [Rhizobium halophytocola]